MIRPETIRKRLNFLDDCLDFLYGLRRYSFDEFVSNREHSGSAERYLHLSIEAVNDIASHIIAELNLGYVDAYSDIPDILYKKKYIDETTRATWKNMSSFRNVLVHHYIDIDAKIVYETLHTRLEFIESLKKVFAQFL
ncbi:MAG: DUF86 domain-containing protein [Anaerolineales bacterium]